MDLKKRELQPFAKLTSIIRSLKLRMQSIDYIEEDGVYKASMGKNVWYIPSKDRLQCVWALNFIDTHERHLDMLREGDVIIEVGAATGEYTIPAAQKIGEKGQLHAFEVEPASYLCLEKNLAYYNIVNVKPVKRAISDESDKSLWLSFDKGSLSRGSFHEELSEKIHVKTLSCDDYAASIGLEKVDVIKATVNGHEPEVMKGAKNLLRNVRIVIFQSAKHQEVISILSKEGFSVKKTVDTPVDEVKIVLMEKC